MLLPARALAGVTAIQDDSARLVYNGACMRRNRCTDILTRRKGTHLLASPTTLQYGGGSVHWTAEAGASVSLSAYPKGPPSCLRGLCCGADGRTATRFSLVITRGPNLNPAGFVITVDAVEVVTVSARADTAVPNATVWTSDVLDPTRPHSITVRAARAYLSALGLTSADRRGRSQS